MSDLPKNVEIFEEGPREGFQGGPPVDTARKVELIHALAETGLTQIDCTSFVNKKLVPQMADAEQVAAAIRKRPGVRYISLWLGESGFERALATPLDVAPSVLCCVSNTAAMKNSGCGAAELIRRQGRLIDLYSARGLTLEYAHVSTAFGCAYEGHIGADQTVATIAELLAVCADHGSLPATLYLSDTIGAGTPAAVTELLDKARSRWPAQRFALHLHDTRGMGLANAWAGLQMGVTRFDASIGGLGGCPFSGATGATGNICTEDLANMCEQMGVATGLDIERLIDCARLAEKIVARPLPGKLLHVGVLHAAAQIPTR